MSSRTASRLSRILAMIPWVIANPGASVAEVCERFGYSERDLAQDLNIVFVCGLPGYGPGDLMEAEIVDDEVVIDAADYFADAPRLAPTEALALLASGLALIGLGQSSDALESAVEKLTRTLMPDESGVIDVDLGGEPELVGELRVAALTGQVLQIRYTSLSREETTDRQVEPWTVFSSLGNWYLMGHCRLAGGRRSFRVDRIQTAAPTGETFPPLRQVPSPQARYTPSADDIQARIALGPNARWVADYYPVEVVEERDDELVVDFSASEPLVTARLLLRLGPAARLVEGQEVAESLEALRRRILASYEG
ncbi:MAG: helix-turn-helix transcriptional regulator [Actinomycetota bacterium]